MEIPTYYSVWLYSGPYTCESHRDTTYRIFEKHAYKYFNDPYTVQHSTLKAGLRSRNRNRSEPFSFGDFGTGTGTVFGIRFRFRFRVQEIEAKNSKKLTKSLMISFSCRYTYT